MITQILKLIKILHNDDSPHQLASAIALSAIMGLTPTFSLHNVLVLFIVCIFKVNIGFFILGFTLFTGIAWIFDPQFAAFGASLLTKESLAGLWTSMYQYDFWRLSHFNNTLTLGSFLISLILFLPIYALSYWLVINYREKVVKWVSDLPVVQTLKLSKWFQRLAQMYSASEVVK